MATVEIKIEGMTCEHCERAVTKALEAVPGVERVVTVSRERGAATVEGAPEVARLIAAVREEGYRAEAA